ncbi:AP-1-like transcription factor [Gnomoniopsis smithogilvyi]|uniref:AP-1-like transcription factor n=1 Tax=Gnomoniopsis smithogilvyi TaxID=1191159 RepID=A0A9W8YJF9_9PEZI|nr:AP-1-like transcription factor [Gnomoniopsis smithogilvyi]
MDYSQHAAYFAGPPQQAPFHQFPLGIAPLTPSHSNSAASDDFNNTSPPDAFDQYQGEQFQNFDQYAAAHFNAQPPPPFPGPPTPPNHHPSVHTNGQPQPSHPAINGATGAAVKPTQLPGLAMTKSEPMGDLDRQGSNSADEEELTPAQSRRKAQNRAAQRAFRERKERHVKDLEAKLASLEAAQQETATENEKLKRDLQKVSTENEILRATSSVRGEGGGSPSQQTMMTTGPMEYNPTDFYSNVLSLHPNKTPSHRIVTSDSGQRLYAAGATWDFIIGHELYKRGLVDIADISNRLKHQAQCDGQGPVFEEKAILEAIEQSVASGSDELL